MKQQLNDPLIKWKVQLPKKKKNSNFLIYVLYYNELNKTMVLTYLVHSILSW